MTLRRSSSGGRAARGEGFQPEEAPMKVVHCPCGQDVSGETDDELVANVEKHIDETHPDLAGKYSREEIMGMAHEH
jgi:hypothetical protein